MLSIWDSLRRKSLGCVCKEGKKTSENGEELERQTNCVKNVVIQSLPSTGYSFSVGQEIPCFCATLKTISHRWTILSARAISSTKLNFIFRISVLMLLTHIVLRLCSDLLASSKVTKSKESNGCALFCLKMYVE